MKTEDEGLVYIIAHDAFQYLWRTKQIEIKIVEIDADAYAEEMLGAFASTGTAPSPIGLGPTGSRLFHALSRFYAADNFPSAVAGNWRPSRHFGE